MESRVRYLDAYSPPENYLDVYLGEEKIQEVSLYELDFGRCARKHNLQGPRIR